MTRPLSYRHRGSVLRISRLLVVCCSIFLLLFTKVTSKAVEGGQWRNNSGKQLDTFDISLDDPPVSRWKEIMEARIDEFHTTMDWIVDHVVPTEMLPKLTTALDLLGDIWPKPEYRQEIAGIARVTGREEGLVLLLNLVYELSAGCTSIVAQNSVDGSVWHGRNLDFDIPHLQELAVNVRFFLSKDRKEDKRVLVYEGTTYAGYIGVLTGVKPGAFSLSQDQRDTENGSVWENLLEFLLSKGKARAYPFLFRDIFETASNYDEALQVLKETPTIAPAYAILAGTQRGEGAVVSRDREKAVDVWTLSDKDWFLVETNDDHWKPPRDNRREAANTNMRRYHPSNMNADALWWVMSQHPTLNELTTYTAVMNAQQGFYESELQNEETKTRIGSATVTIMFHYTFLGYLLSHCCCSQNSFDRCSVLSSSASSVEIATTTTSLA